MKIYKVMASGYSDEDDVSMVIVAPSPERALEIAKIGQQYDWKNPNKHELYWDFNENQYPLIVEEIDLNVERVVAVANVGG